MTRAFLVYIVTVHPDGRRTVDRDPAGVIFATPTIERPNVSVIDVVRAKARQLYQLSHTQGAELVRINAKKAQAIVSFQTAHGVSFAEARRAVTQDSQRRSDRRKGRGTGAGSPTGTGLL